MIPESANPGKHTWPPAVRGSTAATGKPSQQALIINDLCCMQLHAPVAPACTRCPTAPSMPLAQSRHATRALATWLASAAADAEAVGDAAKLAPLFDALADGSPAPDGALPEIGIGLERERALSPPFVRGERYGTRCSSVGWSRKRPSSSPSAASGRMRSGRGRSGDCRRALAEPRQRCFATNPELRGRRGRRSVDQLLAADFEETTCVTSDKSPSLHVTHGPMGRAKAEGPVFRVAPIG